jgi:uncharacterized membrane protein
MRTRTQATTVNKKKIVGFIFFAALFFSIFIECFGFNLKNIVKPNINENLTNVSYVGFDKDSSGNLVGQNNEAQIKLKFDTTFIKNFQYDIKLIDRGDKPIQYTLMVNGRDRISTHSGVFQRRFGLTHKTITLNETTEEITFNFTNAKDYKLYVKNFQITNHFQFNIVRFLVIFIFVVFFLTLLSLKKLNIKLEMFVASVILVFGLLLAFLVPPHHTWDEFAHFLKSYSVASGNFFPDNETKLTYPKEIENLNHPAGLEYQSYGDYKELKKQMSEYSMSNSEDKNIKSTAIINLFVPYIPSGIGVKIAMLFNLPILYYLWFGRMMNVLLYALMAYLAIKKMPVGKRLVAFYAALPINVFLSASLSCDYLAMGGIMLALAYTLDAVLNKKKANAQLISLLIILYSCVTFAKVSYAPFFLLMFLLGKEQFSNKKQLLLYRVLVVISCGIVAIGTYYYADQLGIVQWVKDGVNNKEQILGILKNPFGYLKMLTVFISDNSVNYLRNMFGFFAYVGDISQFSVIIISGILLFLAWFDLPNYSKTEEDQYILPEPINNFGKITLALSSIAAFGLSLTALYVSFTPVGQQGVQGFQGRYILPLLYPSLFILRNKNTYSPYKKEHLEKLICAVLLILMLLVFKAIISYFYNS